MDELYRYAGQQGWTQLSLGVHQGNAAAVRLYEKQGWQRVKEFGEYQLMIKQI